MGQQIIMMDWMEEEERMSDRLRVSPTSHQTKGNKCILRISDIFPPINTNAFGSCGDRERHLPFALLASESQNATCYCIAFHELPQRC